MNLDRENARDVLVRELPLGYPLEHWMDRVLDALEGCVAPDPRLARLAAEVAEAEAEDRICIDTSEIRAVLGGGPA